MNPQYFFLPILQYIYYSNTHCEEILITPTFLWYNHTRKTRKTVVGDDSMIKKLTFVYLLPLEYLYFLFYFLPGLQPLAVSWLFNFNFGASKQP